MSCLTLAAWISIIWLETITAHHYNLNPKLRIHCYDLIHLQHAATYWGSMCNYRFANILMQASVSWSGPSVKFTDRIWFWGSISEVIFIIQVYTEKCTGADKCNQQFQAALRCPDLQPIWKMCSNSAVKNSLLRLITLHPLLLSVSISTLTKK